MHYGNVAVLLMPVVGETFVTDGALKFGTDDPPDNKFTVPVGVTINKLASLFVGDLHDMLQT
jgi:hypothetical protein